MSIRSDFLDEPNLFKKKERKKIRKKIVNGQNMCVGNKKNEKNNKRLKKMTKNQNDVDECKR